MISYPCHDFSCIFLSLISYPCHDFSGCFFPLSLSISKEKFKPNKSCLMRMNAYNIMRRRKKTNVCVSILSNMRIVSFVILSLVWYKTCATSVNIFGLNLKLLRPLRSWRHNSGYAWKAKWACRLPSLKNLTVMDTDRERNRTSKLCCLVHSWKYKSTKTSSHRCSESLIMRPMFGYCFGLEQSDYRFVLSCMRLLTSSALSALIYFCLVRFLLL